MVVHYSVRLASQVLESDALYFELGAQSKALPGATLAWIRGLAALPAGCVVQRVRPAEIGPDPGAWVRLVEGEVRETGTGLVRIYSEEAPVLDAELEAQGYCRKRELAFVGRALEGSEKSLELGVRLREVVTEADWQAKEQVHRESPLGPDGHVGDAAQWVDLLRRKVRSGGKQSYLVESEGEVCGTVGAMEMDDVLRLKNIVIRPSCRGRGLGLGVVYALHEMAAERGKNAMGVFAVEDSPGERMYRRAGMSEVAVVSEWTKQLPKEA